MSSELVNTIATIAGIIVAVMGAFLFAFWVAMGIWTFNDIRSRTRDWLAILLACVLVLIFPIVGLVLYTMIRPKESLAEVYDRALEEEALLREIEETLACPSCGVPVKDNWVYCPNCHNQLQHTCPNCANLVRNDWEICVYCGQNQQATSAAMTRRFTPNPLRRDRDVPQPQPQVAAQAGEDVDETMPYRPVRVAK
jgi:RNA polymerase subunit RPABC4/transcription elongation factor Spt4